MTYQKPLIDFSIEKKCLTAVSVFFVFGCASGPIVPEVVRVPVPIPCVQESPSKPAFLSDAELLALDDFGLVVSLARERRLYQGYTAEIEAVIAGCR